MARTIIVHTGTRAVLVIDPIRHQDGTPILPTDVPCAATDIADAEAAKFAQTGVAFSLDPDGQTIVTTPQPPDTASLERAAATGDLKTQYDSAIARLDAIIGASSPTNAQVVAAVQDLATILRRTLRLLKATVAP